MSSFRPLLERATRVEDDKDWSMHTVDYASYKRMLRHFSKRRANLRVMLSASDRDRILESDLDQILGPPSNSVLMPTESIELDGTNTADTYVPFVDSIKAGDSSSMVKDKTYPEISISDGKYDNSALHYLLNRERGGRFWGARYLKRRAVMRQVSNFERNEVVVFMTHEMDKVAMFYLAQWQRLSQQLLDYSLFQQEIQQQQLGNPTHTSDTNLVELGHEILELDAFCAINIVTIRQMLIRYDAFARSFEGTPMLHYFMKKIKSDKSMTSFRKILQHEELHALAESFLGLCAENLELGSKFQQQRQEFQHLLESSERAEITSSAGHAMLQDTLLENLRYYFLMGMVEDRIGYEPAYLTSRGTSLTHEMQILAAWREDDHLTKQLQKGQKTDKLKLSWQEMFNLALTLVAAFLFCMNYYIVEPSSTMYVNALGCNDAMSGALIGMMPIASFTAAIFWSTWTNYSFRQPFLLSCVLLIGGNILYSSAFNFKSIEMALAGRFLTGLGGPKCIVRRYMADTTSLNLRTSVNAGFGMVVAAGSALGPGCAILLNHLDFAIPIPNGEIWFNGMTGPGYFMALLWTIFSISVFIIFQEPDRSGLEEQKTKEAETTSNPMSEKLCPTPGQRDFDHDFAIPESRQEDDLPTIYSGTTKSFEQSSAREELKTNSWWKGAKRLSDLVTFPVRICLGLLFAKVFVIETLVSATSALTKNRYGWQVQQVGALGCINGLFVIPLSIIVGRLSMSHQDRALMLWLLSLGLFGVLQLVDITDLISDESTHYNSDEWLAVHPPRYVIGYFLTYISIQSFEGVIGSALSKLIPTALAAGTFNSALLATLVDTFGRSCGDLFISLVGFINLRQLMNLLFIPGAIILITCLIVVRRHYDLLAV